VSLGRIDPSAGTATTSGGAPIHRSVEPGLTNSPGCGVGPFG